MKYIYIVLFVIVAINNTTLFAGVHKNVSLEGCQIGKIDASREGVLTLRLIECKTVQGELQKSLNDVIFSLSYERLDPNRISPIPNPIFITTILVNAKFHKKKIDIKGKIFLPSMQDILHVQRVIERLGGLKVDSMNEVVEIESVSITE